MNFQGCKIYACLQCHLRRVSTDVSIPEILGTEQGITALITFLAKSGAFTKDGRPWPPPKPPDTDSDKDEQPDDQDECSEEHDDNEDERDEQEREEEREEERGDENRRG